MLSNIKFFRLKMFTVMNSMLRKEIYKSLNNNREPFKSIFKIGIVNVRHLTNTSQTFANVTKEAKSFSTKKVLKLIGIGAGVGTTAAIGYMYKEYKGRYSSSTTHGSSSTGEYYLDSSPPSTPSARSIQSQTDNSGLKITIYQYQTCPFCCKVRSFLDYYGFSYDVVEVNSATRAQTRWSSYRKVPFLIIEQKGTDQVMQLKDSTMIISALRSFIINKQQTLEDVIRGYPTHEFTQGNKTKVEIMNKYNLMYGGITEKTKNELIHEETWRRWVDDVYIHLLSPNVYRTMTESFDAFKWFSKSGNWEETFTTWERFLVNYVGPISMFFIGKILKRRHSIKDDVRKALYEDSNVVLREIKKRGGKYLGGDEPHLGDLALYGALLAIEGCETFEDMKTNTKIERWFARMKENVSSHKGQAELQVRGVNLTPVT